MDNDNDRKHLKLKSDQFCYQLHKSETCATNLNIVLQFLKLYKNCNDEQQKLPEDQKYEIYVRNPETVSNGETCYTTYEVQLQTGRHCFSLKESVTRRRYEEFVWLAKILKRIHPLVCPPPVPPSAWFLTDCFSEAFVQKRCSQLEEFMRALLRISLYLSNRALHLFLQSDLTTRQIEANLTGQRDDDVVDLGIDIVNDMWLFEEEELFFLHEAIFLDPTNPQVILDGGELPAEPFYMTLPVRETSTSTRRTDSTTPCRSDLTLFKSSYAASAIPIITINGAINDYRTVPEALLTDSDDLSHPSSGTEVADSAIESSCGSYEGEEHHKHIHSVMTKILISKKNQQDKNKVGSKDSLGLKPNGKRKSVSFSSQVNVVTIDNENISYAVY